MNIDHFTIPLWFHLTVLFGLSSYPYERKMDKKHKTDLNAHIIHKLNEVSN